MNCNEAQERLGEYWDLKAGDPLRKEIETHLQHCKCCKDEYDIWKESVQLIRNAHEETPEAEPVPNTTRVMKRIYEEERWRMPIAQRAYEMSSLVRKSLTAAFAFGVVLFVFSLFYHAGNGQEDTLTQASAMNFGLQPVAVASGHGTSVQSGVLTASLSPQDPVMLKVVEMKLHPDYLVALSVVGMICMLLFISWLSRTRA
ncbi:anti-sigma factor family protein [Paenibacillus sp. y28]|uniref:anti-sigma factor family protein n=1 Tax=Paenibacillus sp. y28 TaxID=3129110 RepID=UPI003016C25A